MEKKAVSVLRIPELNRGLAFSNAERRELRLEGLLPPAVRTQKQQVAHVMGCLKQCASDLDRYSYLASLQDRNEKLFYRVMFDHLPQLMSYVYTPTVGEACKKFGYLTTPSKGLYITIKDRNRVREVLQNVFQPVKAIVITDGERILGLGDLGTFGMGIPIGKSTLYCAGAGIPPSHVLPVCLDVGTDNEKLLKDEFYTGLRQKRDRSEAYDEIIEEFVEAVKEKWGDTTLIQFEDFGNRNAFRLLEKFQDKCLTFNDDIQGTAAVTLAGILAACQATNTKLKDHVFCFLGAGSAGLGIASLICEALCEQKELSMEEARRLIWLVDSKGLVTEDRENVSKEKKTYAQKHDNLKELKDIVKSIKATCLLGTSTMKGAFSKEVLEQMAQNCERPLIFPMSNPTDQSECTAEEAYNYTKGKCLFGSGSPFPELEYDGNKILPGQCNNSYIFPGMGLGLIIAKAKIAPSSLFYVAAKAVAEQVTKEDLKAGSIFPPLNKSLQVSTHIAQKVAEKCREEGISTLSSWPNDLIKHIKDYQYNPDYDIL